MAGKRWPAIIGLLAIGGVAGAAAIIVSTEINRRTSTDAFCTSCHSMATVADDPHYKQSIHRANSAGIRVGCADCHLPPGNWFTETYDHAAYAVRDVFAEYTHNFNDPAAWAKRRSEIAGEVRDEMRRSDSASCRKCHDAAAIRPVSEAGRGAHAIVAQPRTTCVDCHTNLEHAPAAATSAVSR
jgi:nitrate/TMAO reductase-like tetraheme cytochrome c subunit